MLFWYVRHPEYPAFRKALLEGYTAQVETPTRALDALDTLILARATTYLGWAADRPGDETSEFLEAEVLPVVVELARSYLDRSGADAAAPDADAALLERRGATIGPYSPLFYNRPLHFVSGDGVWLTDVHGERYLDAYNNVPSVGHANPRVADAISAQLHKLNVHTRYLSEPIVDYAEALLGTFGETLDRVYFTNSGSESNELALRIARHRTGATGILVTDFSYHGNTISLAQLTTGLEVSEPFGEHVRTLHVPDLDTPTAGDDETLLAEALAGADTAIAELQAAGHGVCALLIDSSFSTEGLPRLPEGYLEGLVARVRAAGGLIIADEVQAGLGRLGDDWWGHDAVGITPDFATLGKPLGNGFPIGGVVTTAELLESFSPSNMYFNTFAGTPAAAAAGHSTLLEVEERGLVGKAGDLGRYVGDRLGDLASRHDRVLASKGRGLFFGLSLVDAEGRPDGALAKEVVESLVRERILISKIGPFDSVLKIRPPLVIERPELDTVIDALDRALTTSAAAGGR
ncbi:aminotransferase class III-fold pyridoxal phosphate-dependent enzyme [Pseudoclavibacter endophyticus]|uniref:Aminotransferase class III-fold pyridoxal phosphate-dependent enzyme n=2 Tax=Pseudoclavibacter endophyticus TaxID=1778590 RepID=A0A6H9WQZ9_9MICO|nr:aminotransferase class III-fold pyridoxal phosphate-dependent enzyme [Pseudoclavibacter endophyticus]